MQRRTMLCISSIVFLVVLALHVVTAARRAPGIGDFERVLALFIIGFRALVRGSAGMCASCQTVDLPCFI